MNNLSEHEIQSAFFRWCEFPPTLEKYPEVKGFFAVPNGIRTVNIRIAVKAKAEGLRRGVPDTFLPVARGEYYGLFIEFKTPKNYLSRDQKEWFKWLKNEGFKCEIAKSTDEAIKITEDYLELKRGQI